MQHVKLKQHLFEHIQVTTASHREQGKWDGMVVELCDVMTTLGLCLMQHPAGVQGKPLRACSAALLGRIKDPALRVLLKKMSLPFSLPLGVFNELESLMDIALAGTYRELNKSVRKVVPQQIQQEAIDNS